MKGSRIAIAVVTAALIITIPHGTREPKPVPVKAAKPHEARHEVLAARSRTPEKPVGYTSIKQLPKVWQRLAWCESRWHADSVSPSGLHHGYFQIHQGFFTTLGLDWRTATLQQQWEVAQYVYHRQGAKAWSCAKEAGLK